jgi:hypothetical protein
MSPGASCMEWNQRHEIRLDLNHGELPLTWGTVAEAAGRRQSEAGTGVDQATISLMARAGSKPLSRSLSPWWL